MKKAYIIHRWGGDSTSDWVPWLKEELEARGITTSTPDMPNPNAPTIAEWTGILNGLIIAPDQETCIIGHSVGCQAIVRYLSSLPENEVVGKVVLVAPWTQLINVDESTKELVKQWTDTEIEWESVKKHCSNFTVIYSDDDPKVSAENAIDFGNKINAKLILEENRGHFTDDDDVTQLPVALEETLS
jgi:predicted alpha/beta hydrolase family esterase